MALEGTDAKDGMGGALAHAAATARRPGTTAAQHLLEGRGWVALRAVTDVLMLALGTASAIAGASAARVDAADWASVALYLPLALIALAVRGSYNRRLEVRALDPVRGVLGGLSLAALVALGAVQVVSPETDASDGLIRAWAFTTAYVAGARLVLGFGKRRARRSGALGRPTLIIGAGRIGAKVERRLESQPELGLSVVGYLDSDPLALEHGPIRRAPVLGTPEELGRVVEETGAQHVVFAFLSAPDSVLVPLVREGVSRGLEMSVVPRLFDSVNVRVGLEHIGGMPLYGLRSIDPKGWQFGVKHVLGRLLALLLAVLTAPVWFTTAVAIKLSSPGPVLFRQTRIGRDGREFEMFKLRSMDMAPKSAGGPNGPLAAAIPHGSAPGGVEGVDRRTHIGRFIRRYSIDELPQLLNVLRGEMTLVGPRPERPQYVTLFGESVDRYGDRHRVKSGITGWAQVHGLRGQSSLFDRIEWDNYYIENWSLWLDVKILLMTVGALFHRAE